MSTIQPVNVEMALRRRGREDEPGERMIFSGTPTLDRNHHLPASQMCMSFLKI